jgi:hypothetical protein
MPLWFCDFLFRVHNQDPASRIPSENAHARISYLRCILDSQWAMNSYRLLLMGSDSLLMPPNNMQLTLRFVY